MIADGSSGQSTAALVFVLVGAVCLVVGGSSLILWYGRRVRSAATAGVEITRTASLKAWVALSAFAVAALLGFALTHSPIAIALFGIGAFGALLGLSSLGFASILRVGARSALRTTASRSEVSRGNGDQAEPRGQDRA